MKSRKNLALLWIFSALPAVALLFLYGRLPEQVPTNFGFDGTVNAYSPRSTMWLLALLGPFMALMFQILPQIDPKRRNYVKFQKYYDQFAIFLELFLLVVFSLTLTESLRPGTVSIGRAVTALVSVLLILIGNMMGKIKHPLDPGGPGCVDADPLPGRKIVVCPGAGPAAGQFPPAGAGVLCAAADGGAGIGGIAVCHQLSVVPRASAARGIGYKRRGS